VEREPAKREVHEVCHDVAYDPAACDRPAFPVRRLEAAEKGDEGG